MTNEEINEKVARKLGWYLRDDCWIDPKGHCADCGMSPILGVPPYSTDIAAAFEIVEYLISKQWQVRIDSPCNTASWACSLMLRTDIFNRLNEVRGDTAAMSICLAFLKLEG